MPQSTQSIAVTGYDTARLSTLAYGTLESLGWTIKYAMEKTVVAYTPRSWNKYDNEITVETGEQQLTVTSKSIHGEIADLAGRNKKFVAQFLAAFDSVKTSATEEQLNAWKEKTSSLQEETKKIAADEINQSEKIDNVMNLSKSNLYITYGIMAINVIVFVMMVVSGVALLDPTGLDIIKWGGNFSPLTLSGDWWRLLSSVFVHIGIIHIAFNMYAFFMVGVYLEPMLGKTRFISAYLATGICASLTSLWWHDTPVASAGASGAIFGMYGVFLALLSTKLIPKKMRDELLKSIGIFIVYNLVYGMQSRSGIDNAAHIGGLVSGLIIGYAYYLGWKGENAAKKKNILAGLVMIAAIGIAFFYIEKNKTGKELREEITSALNTAKFKDGKQMLEKLGDFNDMEVKALEPFNNESLSDEEKIKALEEVSLPEWEKARNLFSKMKRYDVSENDKKKINLLAEYTDLRIEEIGLLKDYYSGRSSPNSDLLSENSGKINDIIERLKELQ